MVGAFSATAQSLPVTGNDGDWSYFAYEGEARILGYDGAGGEVVIPSVVHGFPVKKIGSGTSGIFMNSQNIFTSVLSITIPNTVTTIDHNAFEHCYRLTNVVIPHSVTSLGVGAFRNCESLTSVEIANGITQIYNGTFSGCNLTNIILGRGVAYVGDNNLHGKSSLTRIETDSENPNYASVDGVLYNKALSELVIYPAGRQGAFVIPGAVTTIGAKAFFGSNISNGLAIPSSVTRIEDSAFEQSRGLGEMLIPGNVTHIGARAFWGSSMTDISIPNSVTNIGFGAFAECRSLNSITIPDSVTNFQAQFENCSAIKSIIIPTNSIMIPEAAFRGCGSLTNFSIPPTVVEIRGRAFAGCGSLTNLVIPPAVYGIGEGAFAGCSGLTNHFVIPEGVTAIGPETFYGAGISGITIPSSVQIIGNLAFSFCPNLKDITIPDGVLLGRGVFSDCEGLTNVVIGQGITGGLSSAFRRCPKLLKFTVASGDPNYASPQGILYDKTLETIIRYPPSKNAGGSFEIPGSVRSIGEWAFENCKLTNVIIPTTVTLIGGGAFKGAALRSVHLPNSSIYFATIDGYADTFAECVNLTNMVISGSLSAIPSGAFRNTALTRLIIPQGVSYIGEKAFDSCFALTNLVFLGPPPENLGGTDTGWASIYYRPGVAGWDTYDFGGRPHGPIVPKIKNSQTISTNSLPKHKVTFETLPGIRYSVQKSLDLGSWTTVQEIDGDGTDKEYEETPGQRAFFRIRQD